MHALNEKHLKCNPWYQKILENRTRKELCLGFWKAMYQLEWQLKPTGKPLDETEHQLM